MTEYLKGTVAPGFESLRTLFESNLSRSRDHNAQLCVYLGEECVVDLWASLNSDENFSADSLVNVFSSGKSLESILLAILADRGLLDFNAQVTKYWPEFRGSDESPDKCDMTVADVMRHEAGLPAVEMPAELLTRKNIKAGAVSARPSSRARPPSRRAGSGGPGTTGTHSMRRATRRSRPPRSEATPCVGWKWLAMRTKSICSC